MWVHVCIMLVSRCGIHVLCIRTCVSVSLYIPSMQPTYYSRLLESISCVTKEGTVEHPHYYFDLCDPEAVSWCIVMLCSLHSVCDEAQVLLLV